MSKRSSRLEAMREQVIELLATGESARQVAVQTGFVTSTITRFGQRNATEIAERKQALATRLRDVSLAVSEERIRELADLYQQVDSWQQANSLSERTVRYDGEGNVVGGSIKFRKDVVDAKRGIMDDIAAEMGHRSPKAAGNTFNTVVINRYIHGPQANVIDGVSRET